MGASVCRPMTTRLLVLEYSGPPLARGRTDLLFFIYAKAYIAEHSCRPWLYNSASFSIALMFP